MTRRTRLYVDLISGITGIPICMITEDIEATEATEIHTVGTSFHTNTTSNEQDSHRKARDCLVFIEEKIFSELKTKNRSITTSEIDVSNTVSSVLFVDEKSTYDSMINKIENDNTDILSHIACIVAMSYFINNKVCATGNNKAVYTMQLAEVYESNLQLGFLLRPYPTPKP
jgi:hypothetical protein